MRIAAMADIHAREKSRDQIKTLFKGVKDEADVLVLAGDLTDNGRKEEAETLARELKALKMQVVAVLGNHDHESDQAEIIIKILSDVGVCVLDATLYEIGGVGFAGTKGFCGGFGRNFILPFGERALKTFIQTSLDESVRLETVLAKMHTNKRLAVLHYAPITDTIQGENLEIYPFLGSSRLANALDRQGVDVIVHGHAHNGSPEGRTPGGIPVYNVSRFVLERFGKKPYCLLDL